MDLCGKNVVYVGGFGGIGMEACKAFLKRNIAKLIILDLAEKPDALCELRKLNPNTEVSSIKTDVTDKKSLKCSLNCAVSKMKFIDILVYGSGVANDRNIELTVNVNLAGMMNTNIIALPLMDKSKKGRGGMIVNISSALGIEPCPAYAVYSATKAAVIQFSMSMADPFYYDRTGVNVIAVCPGLTFTGMVDNPSQRTTFENETAALDQFFNIEGQEADVCAENIVKCVEKWENGRIWIVEKGQIILHR